jgi:cobalt-zinc-cadmium efflux system protein
MSGEGRVARRAEGPGEGGPGSRRGGAPVGARDRSRYRRLLGLAIGITAAILGVEVVGGLWSNSLALLSDAGHVTTDLLALAFSYTAIVISERPPNSRKSFGYYRVEILAALLNGAILIVIALLVLREAVGRLAAPAPVASGLMLLTASIGLGGNLAAVAILASARENLNLRAAFLHVLGDTLSSVAVIAASLLLMATGWTRIDAVTGGIIAVVIVVGALGLLKESVDILLEACPVAIDGARVERRILDLPEVAAVHDLHIWSITSGMHAFSGHVVLKPGEHSTDGLLTRLQVLLRDEFEIAHTTIQVETQAFEEIGDIH